MFNPLFGKRNAVYLTVKYRNGAGFSIRSSRKMKLVTSIHAWWQEVMHSVEKEPVHYILRLDFQSLFGQIKTWSTYRVAKEELNFQFTLQEKGNAVYVSTGRKEPGFLILSSGKKEMLSSRHVK